MRQTQVPATIADRASRLRAMIPNIRRGDCSAQLVGEEEGGEELGLDVAKKCSGTQ